jgi:hypothetical protein
MTGHILKTIRSFNRIKQEDYAKYCGYRNRTSIYRLELMDVVPIRYFVSLGEMIGVDLSSEDQIFSMYNRIMKIEDADIRNAVTIDWKKLFDPPHRHFTYYSLMEKCFEIYGEFDTKEFYIQLDHALREGTLKRFWLENKEKYLLS